MGCKTKEKTIDTNVVSQLECASPCVIAGRMPAVDGGKLIVGRAELLGGLCLIL
jgi:hypothetical protein